MPGFSLIQRSGKAIHQCKWNRNEPKAREEHKGKYNLSYVYIKFGQPMPAHSCIITHIIL